MVIFRCIDIFFQPYRRYDDTASVLTFESCLQNSSPTLLSAFTSLILRASCSAPSASNDQPSGGMFASLGDTLYVTDNRAKSKVGAGPAWKTWFYLSRSAVRSTPPFSIITSACTNIIDSFIASVIAVNYNNNNFI